MSNECSCGERCEMVPDKGVCCICVGIPREHQCETCKDKIQGSDLIIFGK